MINDLNKVNVNKFSAHVKCQMPNRLRYVDEFEFLIPGVMASVKKEERREDRKFVALPPETVQLVAETAGVSNLQPTVAAALSEDASYRVREMAHVSCKSTVESKPP